uniref:Uncharacterized protein n=1 Tax=Oryza glumipatula TaxID=40148 RepID=A0A0D9ZC41_9ORYZ
MPYHSSGREATIASTRRAVGFFFSPPPLLPFPGGGLVVADLTAPHWLPPCRAACLCASGWLSYLPFLRRVLLSLLSPRALAPPPLGHRRSPPPPTTTREGVW